MNPGLVVKLRPSGPWRIGPDSGARNRVDFIYHSDSLYSAVASAMGRLGSLEAWLDATARKVQGALPPEVCFSSCFPFLDEIGFVVPPRTVWPPVSRALVSARVRWKSARFVPLGVVQAVLAGQRLDDNHWSVDGPSECLVPAGQPGPFRTAVRWSAAVDRLTGSSERHSTACLEFRPGAGLWTVVSFADEAALTRWLEPVKAAFRLLADTGFGGERSRGWGRAEAPEFIEGMLPDMILPPMAKPEPPVGPVTDLPGQEVGSLELEPESAVETAASAPSTEEPAPEPVTEPEPESAEETAALAPLTEEPAPEPAGETVALAPSTEEPEPEPAPVTEPPSDRPAIEEPPADPSEPTEATAVVRAPSDLEPLEIDPAPVPPTDPEPPVSSPEPPVQEAASTTEPTPRAVAVLSDGPAEAAEPPAPGPRLLAPGTEPEPTSQVSEPILEVAEPPAPETEPEPTPQVSEPILEAAEPPAPEPRLLAPQTEPAPTPQVSEPILEAAEPPAPGPRPLAPGTVSTPASPYWLLSLFTPAPTDAVDWRRGNYAVLARGGRVDSPAGSGELKKQVQMIAEGSVVYAPTGPAGAAADVAPDGFAHPVFRAGFAVSIPLPEVS